MRKINATQINKKQLLTLWVLLLSTLLQAGELTKVGTTAANFLQLGIGPRAQAMGGAFVAVSDDASALYWNPAGITQNRKMQLSYINTEMYADIQHQVVALAYALSPEDNIGLLINYLNFGKMDINTVLKPEGTGQHFDAASHSIGLTYGRQLTDKVSVAVTAKYIEERIWLEVARGYSFDIGALYTFDDYGMRVGMALTNLGPEMGIDEAPHLRFYKKKPDAYPGSPQAESQLVTKKFPLPLLFSLGVSADIMGYNAILKDASQRLTFSFAANDGFDAPFRSNYGLEYGWQNAFFLRAGLYQGYDTAKGALGFGINIERYTQLDMQIDYAWVDYGNLGSLNVWGVEFKL